ncbi:unnamed protein product [Rhizophagus irregularis]|nr:unnamed protein product [Rhizophagus irregularis]
MEQRIKEANIDYYDNNEFINIKEIEIDGVYKANWKRGHNNDSNNVMMGLYGITKINTDKYLLVVEYAEGGTLRNYLEKNFLSLNWINKYELAIQLSVAVEILHERGIVHKDLHSRKCWNGDPENRPTIQKVITTLKSIIKQQLMIQQFNLNHGLFLNGYSIEPSKQAVFTEDGELNISLCEDQPLFDVELDDSLQPSDIFINFPVAEITYIFDLSESFSNFMDDDKGKLCEIYGHLFPNGINLDTREQLTDWMNNLFHDDRVEIISYNNLVPISQLKSETTLLEDEIQPGVANFKEKLTLENWVKNSKYAKWVEEFQLLRGLIIDQSSESRISNENTIDLINIPDVNSNDKFYLKIVKPTTILDEILINDNIISTNSDEDISSFPFIKVSDDLSYEDRVHFLVKGERHNILLNRNNIKPSEKFQQAIEKHLKNDLEIIEFDNIIPLYDILEVEQKKRIDIILNKQNNLRIIMTGSIDLKDSDITKQIIISIEPSLKNKNYEVFGSIISKNNSRLKDIFVTFGSYEIDKFIATIKTSNTNVNIKECNILWMMIGNPSKLSVFSPNNREIHVGYVKQSIKLQRKNSSYSVKTSHKLFQGYGISINCFRPINIKFTGWSKNCVHLNISNSGIDFNHIQPNVEIAVCTLHSDLGNSLIDINGKGYTMGYNLTGNNYIGEPQLEQTNTRKYINKRYPTKSDKEKENKLIIDNKNLEFYLDLSEFVNLEELICSKNQLTSLDISKNKQLTEIDCSQNKLVSLDLNCISRFVNLKELFVGNTNGDRIQQGIYNQFHETGIEFLPDSIMNFRCLADKRSEAKVKKIYEQLEAYTLSPIDAFQGRYNLKAWKKNWKLIKQKKALQQVEKELELDAKFTELEEKESSLRTEEEDLVKKNILLEQETTKLKQLINELNAKLEQKEVVIQQTKQQLEENEKKLKSFTAEQVMEKEILHKEVNELKDELAVKEKDMKQSEKQLEETNMEFKAKEDEAINLKNELNDIRLSLSQIEHKKAKLNNLKKKLEHEKRFTKTGTSGLRKQMDDLKNDLKLSQSKKVEAEAKAKEIENKLKDITKYKEDLLNEQNSRQDYINELQRDKKNLEELETRKSQFKDKQDLINKIEQQNEEKINALENELKEKEELINRLKQQNEKKIVALNNEIKNKEELINNLKQQNEEKSISLNNEIKDKEKLNDKLNEETKKWQDSLKEITALNNQLENKNDSINKLQKQTDELTRLLNEETEKYQNMILTNENSASEELEKIRRKLIDDYEITEKEIRDILHKQAEKAKLDMQLKSLIN